MFQGCTSLTKAPISIGTSDTVMPTSTCTQMFYGCTALTQAPELPATTLSDYCYYYMFYNCKSLTAAPELPATTLAKYCYTYMFMNCTSLNYAKCLATDISATSCTYWWMANVQTSGTFIKNSNMSSWTRDYDGIPTNWTVQDA